MKLFLINQISSYVKKLLLTCYALNSLFLLSKLAFVQEAVPPFSQNLVLVIPNQESAYDKCKAQHHNESLVGGNKIVHRDPKRNSS